MDRDKGLGLQGFLISWSLIQPSLSKRNMCIHGKWTDEKQHTDKQISHRL